MAKLNDLSEMPFGKYKGEPMEKVPASYLLWLWDNGLYRMDGARNQYAVGEYIRDNFAALEMDAKDYLVQHPYVPSR